MIVSRNGTNFGTFSLGVVTIIPHEESTTYVNGNQIFGPTKLKTGCRIILGNNHVFRFQNPDEGEQGV